MAANLRTRPLYLMTAILAMWTVAQFALCRDAFYGIQAANREHAMQFQLAHPGLFVNIRPMHHDLWVRAGLESVAAVVLPTILAVFLIAGGRRWLAGAVAAYPLANVLGGFHEGALLGLGWHQATSVRDWFAYGVMIDSLLLVVVVALLIRALPDPDQAPTTRWGFARVIPVVIVLAGWWVTHHPVASAHDWVWLGDAVTFLVVAALLADTDLPIASKVLAIGLVLPLTTGTIINDLIAPGQIAFPATYFLHHSLIALATAVYVTGVPSAVQWFRAARTIGATA